MPVSLSSLGGSSITPFSPAFVYNFSSETSGAEVVLDLTSTISAGTYVLSGTTRGRFAPYSAVLKDSSNNIVGSANFSSVSQGTYGSTNNGSFSGNITASAPFSKIVFKGRNGAQVFFDSTAPTSPAYHISLVSGTRDKSTTDLIGKLILDSGAIVKTNGPSSLPAGQYKVGGAEWYFNNKYYVMTQSITGNPTGSTNTIRIQEWDFTTQAWTQKASSNPSTISMQAYATFYDDPYYNRVWVFKNGTVMIYNHYMFNTNASGTPTYGVKAWRFDGSSLSGISPVSTYNFFRGSSSYNPTNDEWIHFGFGDWGWSTPNENIKITNAGSVSRMYGSSRTSNGSNGIGLVQNAASPKITFCGMLGSYFGSDYFSGWTNDGGLTGSAYTTNSTTPTNYGWGANILSNAMSCYIGTFNGSSNMYFVTEAGQNDKRTIIAQHPIATTTSANYNLLFNFTYADFNNSNQIAYDSNYVSHLQPINSTQVGLFVYNRNSVNANMAVVPFPVTVTL